MSNHTFRLYVEAMERYRITEIPPGDPDDVAWQVEELFAKHLGMADSYGDYRGENRATVAVVDTETDEVVGGLAEDWHEGEEEGPGGESVAVFKADIIMAPEARGPGMPGLQLARMIVPRYQAQKGAHGQYTMMKLRVTNLRLADWLERQYRWDDSYDQAGGEERTLVMY